MSNAKLIVPIETIELNKEVRKDCIMYEDNLFDQTTRNYYSCSQCPKAGEYICEMCFLNCHQHGNPNKKNHLDDFEHKPSTIIDKGCSCAENNHRCDVSGKVETSKNDVGCFFEALSNLLNIHCKVPIENKIVCYGCYLKCYEGVPLKEAKPILKPIEKCECVKCKDGDRKEKMLDVMIQIMENYKEEKYVNTKTFFHLFFMKQELFEIFIRPIKEMYNCFKENTAMSVLKEQFSKNEKYLKLIKLLVKIYSNDDFVFFPKENTIEYLQIKNNINTTTLDLFNCLMKVEKIKSNCGNENESAYEKINGFIYYCLYFFRKLIVLPGTKVRKICDVSTNFENATPFHRLFLRMSDNTFKKEFGFYGFFNGMYRKLFSSIGTNPKFFPQKNNDNNQKNVDYSFSLIIEYLKWCNLLLSLSNEFGEMNSKAKIVATKLKNISAAFKEGLYADNHKAKVTINKYFQKVLVSFLLNYNDSTFKKYISNEIDLKQELDDSVNEENKEYMRKGPLFFFGKENNNSALISLFQTIFFSSKENMEINSSLYDLMITPEDCYIDTLKNFISSRQKYSKVFLNILDEEIVVKYESELTNCISFIHECKKTTNYYYNSSLEVKEFLVQIQRQLCQAMNVSYSFNKNKEENKFNETNLIQIAAVKLGFFDTLFSFYYLINTDSFIKQSVESLYMNMLKKKENEKEIKPEDVIDPKILEKIREKILSIFLNFVDNTFLFPFFFCKKVVKILSDYDKTKNMYNFSIEQLLFYKQILIKIRETKSKFDFTLFLEMLLHVQLNDKDTDKVNIVLKMLKILLKISSSKTLKKLCCLICEYLTEQKYADLIDAKTFLSLDPKKAMVVINTIKLINAMHDYYYYMFQEKFPIKNIEKILKEIVVNFVRSNGTLDGDVKFRSKEYRVIAYTYAKYYVISPFFLYKESILPLFSQQKLSKYDQYPSLIKNFIDTRIKDDITKEKKEKEKKEKEDDEEDEDNNTYENINNVLEPLLDNFRHFKIHLNKIKNDSKAVFRSFEKLIALPSVFMIYRTLYFTKRVSANIKYLTYEIVILFLRCYQYFLQLVIDDIKAKQPTNKVTNTQDNNQLKARTVTVKNPLKEYDLNTEVVRQTISNAKRPFKINHDIPGIEKKRSKEAEDYDKLINTVKEFFIFEDQSESIKIYLQNVIDCLEYDLQEIVKEPLNLNMLLVKYSKYASGIKKTSFLPKLEGREEVFFKFGKKLRKGINTLNKEDKQAVTIEEEEFKEKVENFISCYKERKEDLEKNSLIDLFVNEKKEQVDFYNCILNDILEKCLEKKQKNFYMEQYYSYFKAFNIIAISNPESIQKYLLDHPDNKDKIIHQVVSQLKILYQLLFLDFHKLSFKKCKPGLYNALDTFNDLVEFLRLLCENHNQKFQLQLAFLTIVEDGYIKEKEKNKEKLSIKILPLRLLEFLLQIPPLVQENYEAYSKRASFSKFFKTNSYSYFEPLVTKMTDFFIELLQGSKSANLFVASCPYCERYLNSSIQAFDAYKNPTNRFYLSEFLRFLVNFLEENAADDSNKKSFVDALNPNKIVFFLIHCTKKLYKQIPDVKKMEEECFTIKQENDNPKIKEFSIILFKAYLDNPEYFNESRFFSIACSATKYLLLADQLTRATSSKIEKILHEFQHDDDDSSKVVYKTIDKVSNWKKQSFSFFGKIMKKVEVSQEFQYIDVDGQETISQTTVLQTVFFVNPDVLLLAEEDFAEFKNNAPYEDENLKLNYLINYLPKFKELIELKKSIKRHGDSLFQFCSRLNYETMLQISALISLFVNFFLIISALYLKSISNTGVIEFVTYVEGYSNIIFWINLFHLFFLSIVFIIWFYFQIFKLKNAKKVEQIVLRKLIKSFLTGDTFLLFWNFFWGLIASFSSSFHFAYSLQLFSLFGLNETMTLVIVSVKMRYKQFLAAGLLMIIFSIIFSAIKYIFFCDDLTGECNRFLYCFLAMITGGIRAGSGLNLEMKSITEPGYFTEFGIEWMFYFSIILIMLNIVNGIIVDTFQEQREKTNNRNDYKKNVCYICNTKRTYFERNSLDYELHINVEHSLINYFQYMLTILKTDKQNLNSLDYQILDQILNNQTGFFPGDKENEEENRKKEQIQKKLEEKSSSSERNEEQVEEDD